jgi:hypothetical protein
MSKHRLISILTLGTNNIHTISWEISDNSKEEVFLYLSTSGQ